MGSDYLYISLQCSKNSFSLFGRHLLQDPQWTKHLANPEYTYILAKINCFWSIALSFECILWAQHHVGRHCGIIKAFMCMISYRSAVLFLIFLRKVLRNFKRKRNFFTRKVSRKMSTMIKGMNQTMYYYTYQLLYSYYN